MNCKPGDMAIITRSLGEFGRLLVGKIVTVSSLFSDMDPPAWEIREPIRVMRQGREFEIVGVEDRLLTPINGVPVHDEQREEVPA